MLKRIRQPREGHGEQGFTLIELLVVIIIIGILLAIAIPAYLGFRDRTANDAAKTHLRAALPAAEAYFRDDPPTGGGASYAGMTGAKLRAIDGGISDTVTVASASAKSYCLTETVNGKTWSVEGPRPSASDFKNNANCR